MKHFSTLLLVAMVLLLQAIFSDVVNAARFGDVTVTEQAVPRPTVHAHGYVEYRFALFNDSTKTQHTVQLVVPGNTWGSSGSVSRSVTLLPKAQGLVSMWQPAVAVSGQGTNVYIDGRAQDEMLNTSIANGLSYSTAGRYDQNVLFSQGVDSRFRDQLGELKEKVGSGSYSSSKEFGQRTTVPVNQWSESWLGYSSFDGLVMTQNEWRSTPAQVREAICSWVEVGGSLLVVGDFDTPDRWKDQLENRGGVRRQLGGSSVPINVGQIKLGTLATIATDALTGWSDSDFTTIHAQLWNTSTTTNAEPMDISSANNTFPVTDSLGVPARGMLAIMLIFAILIGPVNMIVFAKLNKRLWTLVTIPAAAILFSAGVFAYTMLADGIYAVGRAKTFTLLDQTQHQAITLGWLGYYAPLQPSDGLHFDLDTELTPQIGDRMHSSRGSDAPSPRFINWSNDQHLAGGWISSRIPSHFTFRKNQSRRERLQISKDDQGNITVVNGLGSDILTLELMDDQGQTYTAANPITAGQKAKLVMTENPTYSKSPVSLFVATSAWRSSPANLEMIDYRQYLGQNTYVATLQDDVFTEQGLANLKSWKTQSTVFGLFDLNSNQE